MNRDSIDVRLINALCTKPPVALLTMLFAFNQVGQTKLDESFLGKLSTEPLFIMQCFLIILVNIIFIISSNSAGQLL